MKKEAKIRKMLGNNYHLNSDSDGNWKLFRKYSDWELYMSNNNPAIMTSENNTEEELYKFAKEHYVWNELIIIDKLIIIILSINLIIIFMNILIFNNKLISHLTCCTAILMLIISIAIYEINHHNLKVKWDIRCEDFKRESVKNELH